MSPDNFVTEVAGPYRFGIRDSGFGIEDSGLRDKGSGIQGSGIRDEG
jgi:hypothetical protein